MKNITIVLSATLIAAAISCTNSAPRRPTGTTGTAGTVATTGTAGTTAPTTGTAGDGAAGTTAPTTGTAGDGAAGTTAPTSGTAGTGAAGDGAAGTAVAGTNGAAGDGAAGTAAAGTNGAAGDGAAGTVAVVACDNTAVKTAGGDEANCPAKTGWKATANPTPASRGDIPDSQLKPPYAIDGSTGTRYSSGATAAAGFWFQVDMGAAKMVSGITVSTTAATDSSNGYKVEVSTNGTDFTMVVAMCAGQAAATEVINFTAVSARYIRYTNENPRVGADTSWWSIHEFDIRCNN